MCWPFTALLVRSWLQSHHACSLASGHLSTWNWKIYCATGREDQANNTGACEHLFRSLKWGLRHFTIWVMFTWILSVLNEAEKLPSLNRNICYEDYVALRRHCSEKPNTPQGSAVKEESLHLSEDIRRRQFNALASWSPFDRAVKHFDCNKERKSDKPATSAPLENTTSL